jgi:serine kinase of HPr protein (carbohydrate metabolism regulator)
MNKKLSLENVIQEISEKLGLTEVCSSIEYKKKVTALKVRCYRRLSSSLKKNVYPTIAIFTPQTVNQLSSKGVNPLVQFFKNIVFIVVAKSSVVPESIKIIGQFQRIPMAASVFDEYYLESSIRGLIREKVNGKTALHGVLIEVSKKGIFISGASGIGKTTSAVNCVREKGYWIADDIVVFKKNIKGELIAQGHNKIRKYVHDRNKGIIPVNQILTNNKIKKETKLSAIIDVKRAGIKENSFVLTNNDILGTTVPCYKINISASGYFNENLLEKVIRKLEKGRP